jgi:uncharacterized protein YndB with AHSA1/START domain
MRQTQRYGYPVKQLWSHRDIDAPAKTVWELLANPECWPEWGPTVRRAQLHAARLDSGAKGTVTTVMGFGLPFEITAYEDGARWAWKVAGVGATDHTVEPAGMDRCRVGFGVPWPAAPYLAVCRVALSRLETMATHQKADV